MRAYAVYYLNGEVVISTHYSPARAAEILQTLPAGVSGMVCTNAIDLGTVIYTVLKEHTPCTENVT